MPNCTTSLMNFSPLGRKKITASFTGGSITSDGGLLLLREIDKELGLTHSIAKCIKDKRNQSYVDHKAKDIIRQRVYALAAGYEDLNDHDILRKDISFQTMVSRDSELASSATLSRFENMVTHNDCVALSKLLVEEFIASFKVAPRELILDFDPTDFTLYGNQEDSHYHGYYQDFCYLPLYVYCGEQVLAAYLRPSNIDGSKHGGALLKLLVKRLRQAWPNVLIRFRCDGAFARRHILSWCERNNIEYLVGLSRNSRIEKSLREQLEYAQKEYETTHSKQKLFTELSYQAGTWHKARRVVAKVEYNHHGSNLRLVVTNMNNSSQDLYENNYCLRGNMENYIKQQKLDLRADRVSAHTFVANQFRVLLVAFAYILINKLRDKYLKGTALAKAYCGTIRNKLLKIGAIVIKNTRKIKFLFSDSFVNQDLFTVIAKKIEAG